MMSNKVIMLNYLYTRSLLICQTAILDSRWRHLHLGQWDQSVVSTFPFGCTL